jgi:hypothetical protein
VISSRGPGAGVTRPGPAAAVNVQTELDPTANPSGVTLQGVTVP